MWKRLDTSENIDPIVPATTSPLPEHAREGTSASVDSDQKYTSKAESENRPVDSQKLGARPSLQPLDRLPGAARTEKKPYPRSKPRQTSKNEQISGQFQLFVGNLSKNVSSKTLHGAFNQFASLTSAQVHFDRKTGESKGYGFVAFTESTDFLQAFQSMNHKYVGSKPIVLKRARTESSRSL